MRIIIKFHDGCKADILAWLARLPGRDEDRRLLVDAGLDAMKAEFVRASGRPAVAEYREEPPPPCWWWKLSAGLWVRYTLADSGGLFGVRTRTIEVMGFVAASPE